MAHRLSGNNSNYLENLDAPTFKSFATDDASSVDDSWFDRRKETPVLKQGDIDDEKQRNNDKNLSVGSSVVEKAGKEEICCQLDLVSSPLMREKSYEVITTKKAGDFMKGNIIEPVELVGRSPVGSHVGAQQHTPLVAPKNPVQWKHVISKPNDQKRQVKQFPSAKTEGRVKAGSLKPLRVLANKHDGKKATELTVSKATSNQQNVAKLDNNNGADISASVKLNIPGFQEGSSMKYPANERTPEKQRGNHQVKRGVPAWAHSPNVGLRLGQKKALTKPMPFQFGNRSNSAVLTEKLSVQSSKTIKPVVNKQQQSAQKLTTALRVSSTRTVTKEFRFATEERFVAFQMSKNTQTATSEIPPHSQKLNSAKRVQPSVHSSVSTTSTVVGDVKKSHVQTKAATPKMISSKARLYDDYIKQRKDQWKQAELKGQNQKMQTKQPPEQRQQPGPSKARPFKQNKNE
ncbi:hypothetical protein T11_5197 [Trichinella zimbabwensis]|uniref:Uncharacterized protein n=1 Tax=Trichinella zimbabwensis TaxID=268475 RepID=A0A0V1HQ92_9BILA|nr:hypothetical protein T11_5197 [Trichinella zimbabwensis]